jgi:hypothetical protein
MGTIFSSPGSDTGKLRSDPEVFRLQTDGRLFFIGIGTQRNPRRSNHLPGCIMYVAGALGLVGLLAIIISLILIGSVLPAIILGAGVLLGFYSGFALLLLLYLVARQFWSDTD